MDRIILKVTGNDRESFLQGLVTNDVTNLKDGLVYAALLTPQGKYLCDFFLVPGENAILIDAPADLGGALLQRLSMYKLRADVSIEKTGLFVHRGTGPRPDDAYDDPRDPTLGWRAYRDHPQAGDTTDWAALRVAAAVPEAGAELVPNESYILEMGFERLHGVDFRKGCYVGQEVTARMKHKTELRKGLARVMVSGDAEPGTEITANGKPVGRLLTRAGGTALAYLRFDRVGGEMLAGEARVRQT